MELDVGLLSRKAEAPRRRLLRWTQPSPPSSCGSLESATLRSWHMLRHKTELNHRLRLAAVDPQWAFQQGRLER